jgi:NHL repeat/WD40-like Beta Propeller Repeat
MPRHLTRDVSNRTAHPVGHGRRNAVLACLAALLLLATAPAAHAAGISDEEELTRFGGEGSGAGQLELPTGIATDSTTGHVYVVGGFSGPNSRVDEFTPWGSFVKAFGWDVAPGAVNEQQEVRVRAAAGEFKLKFGAGGPGVAETAGLEFNASAAEVKAALNALTNVSVGGGSVSVEANPGSPDGISPYIYVVAFRGGPLAGANVAQITAANGATALSGGSPSTTLEANTRADGTPGGTGLESCTEESGCKRALEGGGAGEQKDARGIAVDAAGDVYVREVGNHRVQKFDSTGRFVLMFGGDVNKTKVEAAAPEAEQNRCTAASGDECVTGVTGSGQGQFGDDVSSGIALGPPGEIFVADKERIQRFNLQGEYEAQAPVPGKTGIQLTFDPIGGDLYATFNGDGAGVHKLDPTTGSQLGLLQGQGAVATDSAGNVFVAGVGQGGDDGLFVFEYGPNGQPLSPARCCRLPGNNASGPGAIGTNAIGDLYVGYADPIAGNIIRSFGPGPVSYEAQPSVPPQITTQFATSVQRDGASLGALINPRFWKDTRYYVQYGIGKCSEGGCVDEAPLPPGSLLTSQQVGRPLRASVSLEGLSPGTTYHYRFVAKSGGGGPVYGIGGGTAEQVGGETVFRELGEESSFVTYEPLASTACPNDALRGGAATHLPDCRAYEMVSPVDKNGDVLAQGGTEREQSAADGEKFTYSSYRSFAGSQSAAFTNQYLASRNPRTGWQNRAILPGLAPPSNEVNLGFGLTNPYKAFSADLCQGWFMVAAEPLLDPGHDFAGYPNIYRRDLCSTEADEALIPVKPTIEARDFYPEPQGASADGKKAILAAQLATGGPTQAYYASDGELHFLCVRPDGTQAAGNCSGGTGSDMFSGLVAIGHMNSVAGAISADGSKVYWTDAGAKTTGSGQVFLRLNPGRPESVAKDGKGNCLPEPEMACTVPVSETKTPFGTHFLAATDDGTEALFRVTEGILARNLYHFTLGAGAVKVAGKVTGLVGASEDLSRIYFVSEEALSGSQANTRGEVAQEGKLNLYLDQEGTVTFIARLSGVDAGEGIGHPNDTSANPLYQAARVTPDGRTLVFISTASLTGYDNTDQVSGKADSEVYRYEVGTGGPLCISCNPSGARPQGREINGVFNISVLPTAASIPTAISDLHVPQALSADGRHLFFESYDPLLPRDSNGKEDVYEWEAAAGAQQCEADGAEAYVAASGGCLSLISSGESPQDSAFADASKDGRDVFFLTNASLLPQDPGLIDVYDARVEGGFPQPFAPAPCEGEACQSPPEAPNDPTPASAAFKGAGNVSSKAPAARKSCAKGKARRHGKCQPKHQKRRAKHNRRAIR